MAASNSRELILDASKGARKNVYFVGPFGTRVSFASQQRRALNLVWAMRKEGVWPTDGQPRVAVIGGGIAGITIAAASRMQGCAVRIFEKEGGILSLQSEASHRVVHPTINFWPEVDLNWTTKFPFFDWHAAPCPKIINFLHDEWRTRFEEEISAISTNATLERIGKGDSNHVPLFFEGGRKEEADLVFVTTGFGQERDLVDPVTGMRRVDLHSYWEQDYFDRWTDRSSTKWLVSGTGDGGVIDALRLTYKRFMLDELALQVLYACDAQPLRDEVKKIERDAQDIKSDNKRAIHYFKKYTEVAEHLPIRAQKLLPDLNGIPPVTLMGQLDHPFDLGSAPIHKIILALSIKRDRIIPKKGKLEIDAAGVAWSVNKSGRESLGGYKLVVRHGADAPLWQFLTKKDARTLKRKQSMLGDYLELESYSDATYFDHFGVPMRDRDAKAFARSRAEQARELLRSRFSVGMKSQNGQFLISADDDDLVESKKVIWPMPKELFGVTVIPPTAADSAIDELTGPA